MPARTVQGLALQARATIVHVWPRGNFEEDAALGEDEDMGPEATRVLIESCCALAGSDWRGTPITASIDKTLDFKPWDSAGACPVPTHQQWMEMADGALPWLRLAFAFMCQSKADLGRSLYAMDRDEFDPVIPAVKAQARNFRQIADMADAALARCIVAMEAHVATVDAEAQTRG